MFAKIMSKYDIITFNKDDYKIIVENISNSKAYICHIDSKNDKGKSNKSYEKYLAEKQYYYLNEVGFTGINPFSFIAYDSDIVDKENALNMGNKHGVKNDYILNKMKYDKDSLSSVFDINEFKGLEYVNFKSVNLIEQEILDNAFFTDNRLEKVNRDYVNKEFVFNHEKRFFMIPFLAKFQDEYIISEVVLHIYDEGFMTIQYILPFRDDNVPKPPKSNYPAIIEFEEVHFYEIKDTYKANDFWSKDIKYNVHIGEIYEYYKKLLNKITDVNLNHESNFVQVAWVFGEYSYNTNKEHKDFVDEHKKLYVSYCKNAVDDYVSRLTNEEMVKYLNECSIIKNKDYHFYCSDTFALLSIGNRFFDSIARSVLSSNEKELKKSGEYEDLLLALKYDNTYSIMFEFLRFYELSFIKKFFLKKLLVDISRQKISSLKEYLGVKKELDFILIKYDDDILFDFDGSPKKLYMDILDKTGTNKLLSKVEKIVSSLKENVQQNHEIDSKNGDAYILVLTSLLAVFLGFTSIYDIVTKVLTRIYDFGIHVYPLLLIKNHPLRITLLVWFIFIYLMYKFVRKRLDALID